MDKFNDFRVAYQAMQGIEERLSQQFMLQSSVQRNGERVTAEEIRYLAGELEDTLSGIYSILSQEFQMRLLKDKDLQFIQTLEMNISKFHLIVL